LFEREHHLRIATVLQALNAELLSANGCLFGGGTAIVLLRNEYRESLDIDLLVSRRDGYRTLRQLLTGAEGLQAILRPGMLLKTGREIRTDQYGIRTMLPVAGKEIKFEIVFESRVELENPEPQDKVCGVATLAPLDMATTKLLANSDRWHDDSVFSRDLIDLAMLALPRTVLDQAIEKASASYGESIEKDLRKAIETLRERPHRLDECMSALKMDSIPKALLWKRIRALLAARPSRRGPGRAK
jgi:hypothetical protein